MDPLDAITHAAVRAALRQLAADRTPGDSPLCRLAIVRRSLRRAGYQPTAEACGFEIGRLLTEIVEAELARLRRRAGTRVSGPPPDERAVLRADFAAGFPELEAWSALYHVYLRPDLGVDLSALAACIDDRHRRTLQRRLRHGVEALAARLRALEHDALSAARDARVRAHLPAPESSRLFGVDGLVNRLAGALIDGGGRPVVALGGAGGIGKTAIARAVAERCLLSGAFDAVVWVDAPACGPPGVIAVFRPETARPREVAAIADRVPAAGAPPAAGVRAESLGRPAGGDRRVAEPPGAAHDLAFGARASNTVRAGAYQVGDDARNGAAGSSAARRLLGFGTDADAAPWLSEDGVAAGAGSRLVVVDGVDDPALARAVVAAAHGARGATQVLLTGRVGWWRLTGVRVTQVPPLPPAPPWISCATRPPSGGSKRWPTPAPRISAHSWRRRPGTRSRSRRPSASCARTTRPVWPRRSRPPAARRPSCATGCGRRSGTVSTPERGRPCRRSLPGATRVATSRPCSARSTPGCSSPAAPAAGDSAARPSCAGSSHGAPAGPDAGRERTPPAAPRAARRRGGCVGKEGGRWMRDGGWPGSWPPPPRACDGDGTPGPGRPAAWPAPHRRAGDRRVRRRRGRQARGGPRRASQGPAPDCDGDATAAP